MRHQILRVKISPDDFTCAWICRVVSSGFHNGARCGPDDPHGSDWRCGWHYFLECTQKEFEKFFYGEVTP